MMVVAEDIRARSGAGRMHRRHLLVAALSRPPTEFPELSPYADELEKP